MKKKTLGILMDHIRDWEQYPLDGLSKADHLRLSKLTEILKEKYRGDPDKELKRLSLERVIKWTSE